MHVDIVKLKIVNIYRRQCFNSFFLQGQFVGAVNKEVLYAFHIEKKQIRRHLMGGNRHFTCIAAHPTDTCIATGDDSGRILLW